MRGGARIRASAGTLGRGSGARAATRPVAGTRAPGYSRRRSRRRRRAWRLEEGKSPRTVGEMHVFTVALSKRTGAGGDGGGVGGGGDGGGGFGGGGDGGCGDGGGGGLRSRRMRVRAATQAAVATRSISTHGGGFGGGGLGGGGFGGGGLGGGLGGVGGGGGGFGGAKQVTDVWPMAHCPFTLPPPTHLPAKAPQMV